MVGNRGSPSFLSSSVNLSGIEMAEKNGMPDPTLHHSPQCEHPGPIEGSTRPGLGMGRKAAKGKDRT
ncbi:hypothetical protein STEG23_016238 [Scotinomys teguina]